MRLRFVAHRLFAPSPFILAGIEPRHRRAHERSTLDHTLSTNAIRLWVNLEFVTILSRSTRQGNAGKKGRKWASPRIHACGHAKKQRLRRPREMVSPCHAPPTCACRPRRMLVKRERDQRAPLKARSRMVICRRPPAFGEREFRCRMRQWLTAFTNGDSNIKQQKATGRCARPRCR
jgi:hypothetical protein